MSRDERIAELERQIAANEVKLTGMARAEQARHDDLLSLTPSGAAIVAERKAKERAATPATFSAKDRATQARHDQLLALSGFGRAVLAARKEGTGNG